MLFLFWGQREKFMFSICILFLKVKSDENSFKHRAIREASLQRFTFAAFGLELSTKTLCSAKFLPDCIITTASFGLVCFNFSSRP